MSRLELGTLARLHSHLIFFLFSSYIFHVITFDNTYLTNKYEIPFCPFVGVNHHGHSFLLSCALSLQDRWSLIARYRAARATSEGRNSLATTSCQISVASNICSLMAGQNFSEDIIARIVARSLLAEFSRSSEQLASI